MTSSDPRPSVEIRYHRPPDRLTVFRQLLVNDDSDCVVTLMERTPLPEPVTAAGRVILEPDAPVVWFTFADAWHDVGRFHTADGLFTGYYANLLTPVRFLAPHVWETTDLFLDVWLDAESGAASLLDEDELSDALERGWVEPDTARAARSEAARLLDAARRGDWPPRIVRGWTLDRARAAARQPRTR